MEAIPSLEVALRLGNPWADRLGERNSHVQKAQAFTGRSRRMPEPFEASPIPFARLLSFLSGLSALPASNGQLAQGHLPSRAVR